MGAGRLLMDANLEVADSVLTPEIGDAGMGAQPHARAPRVHRHAIVWMLGAQSHCKKTWLKQEFS